MASRPTVSVYSSADSSKVVKSVALPAVFNTPIRPDVIHFTHTNLAKNARQPYAVSRMAGMQHSAHSWGTGRAVARIPRVSGGGTHRAGQAAFGNMCRKGRMFAPTKTWRRWHRKVNTTQKRFAVASAVSATAVPALVMARGHRVSAVPELPLILSAEDCASIKKTSQAVTALNNLHCDEDIDRVKNSRKLRAGKGKMRGRRFVQRRGPLVIASSKLDGSNLGRALRNIPGVEIADVDRLNILQLAPGGHVGRFVIWTEQAWNSLQQSALGSGKYSGSVMMSNPDVARIINSDEVQSVLRVAGPARGVRSLRKRNALTNLGTMIKLNPYSVTERRRTLKASEAGKQAKAGRVDAVERKRRNTVKKNVIAELRQEA